MLRNEWNINSDQIIETALKDQQQCAEEFGIFLNGWKRKRFERAWKNYRIFCETLNYTSYLSAKLYPDMLRQQGAEMPPDPRPRFIKLAALVELPLLNRTLQVLQGTNKLTR